MRHRVLATAGVTLTALGLVAASTALVRPVEAASPVTYTTIDENHPISPGSPINPWNPTGNSYDTLDSWQLAYFKFSPTNPDAFWAALAQRWQLSRDGTALTVWLQPNARWSNGQPVTAQDVKVSAAIWFTQGTAQTFDLSSVRVLGPKVVQFLEVPGTHYQLFEHEVLQQTVVPASYWSTVLPKNIWTTIAALQSTNKAAATKANAALTALGKKLINDGPKHDISDGPFVIRSISPAQIVMTRNPDFWAAGKIKVSQVVLRNYTGNEQIWNYLIAGQLDYAPYTSMPTSVLERIEHTAGNRKVLAASYVGAGMLFNQRVYPYNLLQVRQALAYLIDRKVAQEVGDPVDGVAAQYSDGLVDSETRAWLSPSQIRQLNPYAHNPARAAALLRQAGFRKVGGRWRMPNGKPFTATLYDVNGFSNWIEAGHVIASEMTSFGIPTSVSIVSMYSEYLTNLSAGKYALGFYIMAIGPNPYAAFNQLYGVNDGFEEVGGRVVHVGPATATQTGNFLDTPQQLALPGGGTINPGLLTPQLSQSVSAKTLRPLVAKLALATNRNLPMLTLVDYLLVEFVNTQRFTDLPASNPGLLQYQAGLWMLLGYMHPR